MTQMLCLNNVLLLCVCFVLDTVSCLVSFYFYFCVHFLRMCYCLFFQVLFLICLSYCCSNDLFSGHVS